MTMLDVLSSDGIKLPADSGEVLRERRSLSHRAEAVAAIAARHAVDVDRTGRFPAEAIEALKSEGLLGLLVPASLGGEGAGIKAVADICYRLGRACASTAMIFAMHQVKMACIVHHGAASPWHQDLMRRLAREQLLFASSTTEGNAGGNVRSSAAAIARQDRRITLDRAATVISYGAEADGIVTTARRSEDAAASDQVLLVILKPDYRLDFLQGWDTLGMRGTSSAGFRLHAEADEDQIVPVPYEKIHAESMTPSAHVFWSSAWSGIAAEAVARAQAFTRKAARQAGGQLPPGAAYYTRAQSQLRSLRALVRSGIETYERALASPRALSSIDFQTTMTLLKVDASELAVATVMSAMRACGLSGYRNDAEASIGRHLRDVLSAPIMINNDRILANLSTASLLAGVPESILD